jgi:hypothetical protein
MAETANKRRLHRTIQIVQAAAAWEHAASMLTDAEYAALASGLQALAAVVEMLAPVLPDELQP